VEEKTWMRPGNCSCGAKLKFGAVKIAIWAIALPGCDGKQAIILAGMGRQA
jgi:hypothetical protein